MEVLKEDAEHKERVGEVNEAISGASHILPIITERHSTYCFVIRFFCLPCPRRLRRLASMVLLVGSRLPRVVFAVLVSDDSSLLNRFGLKLIMVVYVQMLKVMCAVLGVGAVTVSAQGNEKGFSPGWNGLARQPPMGWRR